jgi:hypothetical protein
VLRLIGTVKLPQEQQQQWLGDDATSAAIQEYAEDGLVDLQTGTQQLVYHALMAPICGATVCRRNTCDSILG